MELVLLTRGDADESVGSLIFFTDIEHDPDVCCCSACCCCGDEGDGVLTIKSNN